MEAGLMKEVFIS